MSNREYEKRILEKLLEKYHNRIMKHTETNRRIIVKPTEIYKRYEDNNADIREKESLHQAVEMLLRMGAVTVDYLKFSTDIEKIYFCENKADDIYQYIHDQFGITPQSAILKMIKAITARYKEAGELVGNYCRGLLCRAEDPRAQICPKRVEANLKMLRFLEENEEDLYVREASILVYGDSKWFEKNNCEEICNLVRAVLEMPREEGERNDAVLAYFHIFPAEQEIFIKGDWKIEWETYVLETGKLKGGIALSSCDVQEIQKIRVQAPRMMTIENKTSYQRMKSDGVVQMYLGGFASPRQIDFLKKVIRDNPHIIYEHFGDIDVGGFFIHRHLCQMTGKKFCLYCMGTEQLADERFRSCLKELTKNDQARLETLLEEEAYHTILIYMKEHQIKLEQEIISYYLR